MKNFSLSLIDCILFQVTWKNQGQDLPCTQGLWLWERRRSLGGIWLHSHPLPVGRHASQGLPGKADVGGALKGGFKKRASCGLVASPSPHLDRVHPPTQVVEQVVCLAFVNCHSGEAVYTLSWIFLKCGSLSRKPRWEARNWYTLPDGMGSHKRLAPNCVP